MAAEKTFLNDYSLDVVAMATNNRVLLFVQQFLLFAFCFFSFHFREQSESTIKARTKHGDCLLGGRARMVTLKETKNRAVKVNQIKGSDFSIESHQTRDCIPFHNGFLVFLVFFPMGF